METQKKREIERHINRYRQAERHQDRDRNWQTNRQSDINGGGGDPTLPNSSLIYEICF